MKISDLPDHIMVHGDPDWRGECPSEALEQVTFFNRLKREYPEIAAVAIHPRNEQQLRNGQFSAIIRHKSEGMVTGASDIIIPGIVSLVCELKRKDRTKSTLSKKQLEYLKAAHNMGSWTCIALGSDGAWRALIQWLCLFHQRKLKVD